jgi:hypothetical protein
MFHLVRLSTVVALLTGCAAVTQAGPIVYSNGSASLSGTAKADNGVGGPNNQSFGPGGYTPPANPLPVGFAVAAVDGGVSANSNTSIAPLLSQTELRIQSSISGGYTINPLPGTGEATASITYSQDFTLSDPTQVTLTRTIGNIATSVQGGTSSAAQDYLLELLGPNTQQAAFGTTFGSTNGIAISAIFANPLGNPLLLNWPRGRTGCPAT